eukprot:gb/GFBE01050872.1/.p1 GENE.gb/GFBE01050872.1/~~gb/GFBE01050872.1/.p1  ORF type:complete len:612 (+),score=114.26 gb/GFBE01050872.1/:1-1836(+)
MAARLRKLANQLLAVPVKSDAESSARDVPNKATARKKVTMEEVQKSMQYVREYVMGMDELLDKGTFPRITNFDMVQSTNHLGSVSSRRELEPFLQAAEAEGRLELTRLLPGPWQAARTRDEQLRLIQQVQLANAQGLNVYQLASWQLQHGGRGLSSNIAVPLMSNSGSGSQTLKQLCTRVIVADPEDAERLARIHVRKDGIFEAALMNSIISTTDNEDWRQQRHQLAEAFLPLSSMAKILPVSLARAKSCTERLADCARDGRAVDMSDFLLHEAQAQLQLALLGVPEHVMEDTNEKIRSTFQGEPGDNEPGALALAMAKIQEALQQQQDLAMPSEGCPVKGPLSQALETSGFEASSLYGNLLLILFAGHDTTGHTMTWLLFELARHPEIQQALHDEVDRFHDDLGGRDPEYKDLSRLDLMDRCITETLRLWPAVASGTYRQLQFGDTVKGADGQDVKLPKGTAINIVNWPRHRNTELWGESADEFNPYRHYETSELARVGCPMAGRSPQSERFSPFAHAPRSCLGRNFAQMEMRLIMLNLLRSFQFSLAPPYDRLMNSKLGVTAAPDDFRGVNRATMGPLDLERQGSTHWGNRHLYAMKMHVHLRRAPKAQ